MLTEQFVEHARAIKDMVCTEQYDMADATTFKIGGPADLFAEVHTKKALLELISLCKKENVPFLIVGAGSNLLVSDKGIDGVVCRLCGDFDSLEINGTVLTAGSAISLAKLARGAQSAGLSGLEFASGIPGTLGGAIYMNAGAYGGEMKDTVIETEYMDIDGNICTIHGEEHDFAYRHSVFCGKDLCILSAKLQLVPGDSDTIMETMRDLNARRKEKQPLDKPSAGSTFKRPEGYFAAKLIEDAGLKGCSVGGACVSEKHSGFVVNNGNATCEDVLGLIRKVQESVAEQFGVTLETEVKFLGR